MEWKSRRGRRSSCLHEKQKHYSHLHQGNCWRTKSRDRSVLFPTFLLGSSRYLGISVLVTSASNGIPVFTHIWAYTGLSGLSSSVPTGRCCLWATDSLKVNSLTIILSGVVLLTAAVSWQPLSLHSKVQSWMGFPSKVDFVSKDMPVVDAPRPYTLLAYSLHADRTFLKDVFTQEV